MGEIVATLPSPPLGEETLERVIFDPLSEDAANSPLEITGRQAGHAVYLGRHNYPAPESALTLVATADGEARYGKPRRSNRVLEYEVLVAEATGIGQATNLLANPSFEKDTVGWTTVGAGSAIARTTTERKAGEAALEITSPGSAGGEGARTDSIAVAASEDYTAAAWVKGAAGEVAQLELRELDAANAPIGTDSAVVNLNGDWQLVTVTRSFGSGGVNARLHLVTAATLATTYQLDALLLLEQSAGQSVDYFDGDSPGCEWGGTAHASTSTRSGTGDDRKRFIKALHDVESKLAKLQDRGGTVLRVLPDGSEVRFDVVGATFSGQWARQFTQGRQVFPFELPAKPGARLASVSPTTTITDDFSTDTIGEGRWAFDLGAGTIAVSGGQLVPSNNDPKALHRRALVGDSQITLKFRSGGAITGYAGPTFKRLDASNKLAAYYNGAAGTPRLEIYKVDAAVTSLLASGSGFSISPTTDYWVRASIAGNEITAELFTADPAGGADPVSTLTHTLAGADATKFGAGVRGNPGFQVDPPATDWRYDDWKIESDTILNVRGPAAIGVFNSIPGNYPALGDLLATDGSAQAQLTLLGGLQQDTYDPATTAELAYEAEVLTPQGGAATNAGPGGQSGTTILQPNLTPQWKSMLSTARVSDGAHLTHHGSYRMIGRFRRPASNAGAVSIRLEWGSGDMRRRRQNKITAYEAGEAEDRWLLVDLGSVSIPKMPPGVPQRWEGRVLAKSTVAGDDLYCDWLLIVPCEVHWELGAALPFEDAPSSVSAEDDLEGGSGGALNGVALNTGGTYQTGGEATDFTKEAGGFAERTVKTDTGSGRIAVASGPSLTDVVSQIETTLRHSGDLVDAAGKRGGPAARHTDANNFVAVRYLWATRELQAFKRVAGAEAILERRILPSSLFKAGLPDGSPELISATAGIFGPYFLRLAVFASGRFIVWAWTQGTEPVRYLAGEHADLVTGGALASGKAGFYDFAATDVGAPGLLQRRYDNPLVFVPTTDAVMWPSRSARLRHDGAIRQDASGSGWSEARVEGDHLRVPPTGKEARPVRFLLKASRGLIDERISDSGIDDISARLTTTPLVANVPDPT